MRRCVFMTFVLVLFFFNLQAQRENIIEVSGIACCNAIPEIAVLQIPIVVQMEDYKACSDSLMNKLKYLQKQLKKIGVPERQLKSSGFSIEEHFEYNQKREKVGYRGYANLEIKDNSESGVLKEIINILRANEAIYNLEFVLSERQKKELTFSLIESSVKDATTKARMLAKASNLILGEILEIKYGGQKTYREEMFLLQQQAGQVSESSYYNIVQQLDLAPKEVSVQKTVLVRWAIDY